MIQAYAVADGRLRPLEAPFDSLDEVVWFDVFNPTEAEEAALEKAIGVGVPTPAEMQEIEDSSRLYTEDGAAFMTANLPSQVETDEPVLAPVTFILAGERLVTLRYHEPRAFRTFTARAERVDTGCSDGTTTLVGLLEVVVDRLADILEKIGRDIEQISRLVFRPGASAARGAGLPGGAARPRAAGRPRRQRDRQPRHPRAADRLSHRLRPRRRSPRRGGSGSRRSAATPASCPSTRARCRRS